MFDSGNEMKLIYFLAICCILGRVLIYYFEKHKKDVLDKYPYIYPALVFLMIAPGFLILIIGLYMEFVLKKYKKGGQRLLCSLIRTDVARQSCVKDVEMGRFNH